MNRSRRKTIKEKNDAEHAKQLLQPSNITNKLPGREKEIGDIFHFVRSSLIEQVGGCMFISGVPGTGKTAAVHSVMRALSKDEELKAMKNKFHTIEINGLRLSNPNQFYSHFCYKLFGKKFSKQKAIDELENHFSYPQARDPFIVLLVDELDQLCTRKQNILYHLFDWPNRPGARIVILSIANTMDLPERMMMTKIQSRLGLRRLTFQPYRFEQLVEIVYSRLGNLKLFEENAIEFICRKVTAVSGDARRVLDLCRRALDICEQETGSTASKENRVNMKDHASAALREVFQTDKIIAISNCSEQEKIFLQALVQEFQIEGSEVAYFRAVYSHHVSKCRFEKCYVPTVRELIDIAYGLYAKRLILIERNKVDIKSKISLNVSIDEIDYVLQH